MVSDERVLQGIASLSPSRIGSGVVAGSAARAEELAKTTTLLQFDQQLGKGYVCRICVITGKLVTNLLT